jgi:hypothetical protein
MAHSGVLWSCRRLGKDHRSALLDQAAGAVKHRGFHALYVDLYHDDAVMNDVVQSTTGHDMCVGGALVL